MFSARAVLAFVVVFLFAGLTPAAYGDPTDPTWMAGYWDDDDFDDAIVFIMATAAIDVLSPVGETPFFVLVARLDPVDPVGRPAPLRTAVSARAPPPSRLAVLLMDN